MPTVNNSDHPLPSAASAAAWESSAQLPPVLDVSIHALEALVGGGWAPLSALVRPSSNYPVIDGDITETAGARQGSGHPAPARPRRGCRIRG
jgi:hypothetical protein